MEADPVAGSGHPPIGVEQRRGRHSAVAGRLPGPGAPNPQSEVQCEIAIPDAGGEVDAAGHRSDLAVGIDRFDELDEELPSPVHVAVCLALLCPLEEPQGLLSHLPSHGAFPRPGPAGRRRWALTARAPPVVTRWCAHRAGTWRRSFQPELPIAMNGNRDAGRHRQVRQPLTRAAVGGQSMRRSAGRPRLVSVTG
jgi:hypothetical protein